MSTIIIITPPTRRQAQAMNVDGSDVIDATGNVVAQFHTPEQAIAYLKSIKKQVADLGMSEG